ncbi:hypothetical protein FVA74_07890 [Salinibacterium sp. dk2585]|uniref:hypothetical protein n=1 Tax=unclassified Salinibacterium TaxID=2632331 RepID=UPI0011C24C9A|nr:MULTISPECIES: hypothetical protein [unclassified Salinibacterium]QEE61504.1 hypothetical protein FVA74_07890 [Salinibacterium sp. dk2585]TXK54181.1 hypothetical protein FVP63_09340 [Salinibacterium sp. dk5596]
MQHRPARFRDRRHTCEGHVSDAINDDIVGAILGAWGGHYSGRLPLGYRIASAASILIYAFLITVILDRAEFIELYPPGWSTTGAWIVFGYLAFGVLLNVISRSEPERYVMTPVALVLATLALLVALA